MEPKRLKVAHAFHTKCRKVGSVYLDEKNGDMWFLAGRTPTHEIWELQK